MSERDPGLQAEQLSTAPVPRPSRKSALLLWLIAGLGLIVTGFAALPLARLMGIQDGQIFSLIVSLSYYLPFMALPVFLVCRREDRWQALRPYPVTLFQTIAIVALALLGVFFFTDVSALWQIVLEALGLMSSGAVIAVPTNTRELLLSLVDMAILAPVCEEFLFRGAILSAYERSGSQHGLLVAALMFALLHASPEGLPAQFLVGAVLGLVVISYGSIYAGVIYHMSHNAATIILQYIAYRSSTPEELTQEMTMLEAVGGTGGLVMLVIEVVMLGAMMYFTLRMMSISGYVRGNHPVPPGPRERMSGSERLLMIACCIVVALLFVINIYAGSAA